MRHRLFNVLATVSILLCVVAGGRGWAGGPLPKSASHRADVGVMGTSNRELFLKAVKHTNYTTYLTLAWSMLLVMSAVGKYRIWLVNRHVRA